MATVTLLAAFGVVALSTTTAAAPRGPIESRPTVVVHIENYAQVGPKVLDGTRFEVTHILDVAGVRVEWSNEPEHVRCGQHLTVHVLMLAYKMADRLSDQVHAKANVLGQANSDARRIYVYPERVAGYANDYGLARADALGIVIAHELGHVLMPAMGHSTDGIMQAAYDIHASYGLKFTSDQSLAMRTFIADAEKTSPCWSCER